MNLLILLLIGVTAFGGILGMEQDEKIVFCYVGTWANYRPGDGKFKPEHIDPFLCTHVGYSFFGITDDGEIKSLDTWLDFDDGLGHISKTIALKRENPKLKIMAVVGGWNEGSVKYSQLAASPKKTQVFIDSAVKFMKEHGFDGLDLDWEYPGKRGGDIKRDKENFVILLQKIHTALKASNLIFSIAVGASEETAEVAYDIPNVAANVDFINVMTYDFNTVGGGVAGSNTPLEGTGPNNVKASIMHWLDQGALAKKLVLGLAFYGRTFKLSNPQQPTLGATIAGPGKAGPYTNQQGLLGYNEICLNEKQWSIKWSDKEKVPYAHKPGEIISFDDEKSIGLKMDLVNSLNLGGCMIWSIETDDFRGKCGTKYVLLKTINNKIGKQQDMSSSGNELTQESTSNDQTGPFEESDSPKQEDTGDCLSDGFFPIKPDCTSYYRCAEGIRYDFKCPGDLKFDYSASTCTWSNLVQC